jgi:excisionase family DNA binding protein
MPDEWMSLPDVAEALGKSLVTIRRWTRSGKLPVKRFGRNLRVPRAAVSAMLSTEDAATQVGIQEREAIFERAERAVQRGVMAHLEARKVISAKAEELQELFRALPEQDRRALAEQLSEFGMALEVMGQGFPVGLWLEIFGRRASISSEEEVPPDDSGEDRLG